MEDDTKAMAPEELAGLLQFVSSRIYESLVEVHAGLSMRIGSKAADDIIVNAMAVNLGHVLGQMDPKQQRRYATMVRQTIKEHTLAGTILKDQHAHGMIGHA